MKLLASSLLSASLVLVGASTAHADEDAAWDAFERADAAFQESQQACDEADAATTGGDRTCRNAIDDGMTLAAAIEHVLTLESLDEDTRESAIDLLLTTQQIVGTYMVDVGDCQDAYDLLTEVVESPLLGNRRRLEQATRTWQDNAAECVEEQGQMLAESEPAEQVDEPEQPVVELEVPTNSNSGKTAGLVLTGLGGAAILGAVAWEIALMEDRSDFIEERDLCEAGLPDCDTAALNAHANHVNDAKLPTGLLYGVGGAALLTGVILLATSGGDTDEPGLSVVPMLGARTAGATFQANF